MAGIATYFKRVLDIPITVSLYPLRHLIVGEMDDLATIFIE